MVVSIVVCVLIAYMIQFFRLTLDYHGTRKLQFEDDEYYYYVKAVPKIKGMKKNSGRKPEEVPMDSTVIRNRERE